VTFRAACVQMTASRDEAENISVVENLVGRAAGEGARYVQTPEMTNILERDRKRLLAALRPESDSPALRAFSALAARHRVFLHVGSLALDAGAGRIANRAFLIGPDGDVRASYDKVHLFDVDLPNGESWRESATYSPGDRAVVADLPWCRLGLSICYDVRFPQLFRAEAHAGALVLTAPAAFTRQTGEAHWHVLQRARAIENGAFMVSAAQAGRHADGRETYGHSLIVSPWGEVLAEAGGEGESVILAEIDPAQALDARARIPSLRNERPFLAPDMPEPVPLRSAS
jgi:deaminated glutathione amidase